MVAATAFVALLVAAMSPFRARAEAGVVPTGTEVDDFLAAVSVYVVTDKTGAPVMGEEKGNKELVARIFFDKACADETLDKLNKLDLGLGMLEVRQVGLNEVFLPLVVGGDPKQLGGEIRLQPLAREVRNAQQILVFLGVPWNEPEDAVPLFLCSELQMQGGFGISDFIPVFLREADLKAVLKKAGAPQAPVQITTLQAITANISEGYPAGTPRFRLLSSQDNVREISKM